MFLPIIQKQLDLFREAWATHPLRTERNRSPLQLWILGLNEVNVEDQVHNAVTGLSAVSISKKLNTHVQAGHPLFGNFVAATFQISKVFHEYHCHNEKL